MYVKLQVVLKAFFPRSPAFFSEIINFTRYFIKSHRINPCSLFNKNRVVPQKQEQPADKNNGNNFPE